MFPFLNLTCFLLGLDKATVQWAQEQRCLIIPAIPAESTSAYVPAWTVPPETTTGVMKRTVGAPVPSRTIDADHFSGSTHLPDPSDDALESATTPVATAVANDHPDTPGKLPVVFFVFKTYSLK